MPRRGEPGKAGADNDDGGGPGGLLGEAVLDGRGDPEVDVAVGDEEVVGGGEEVVAVGRDERRKGLLGEP